MSAPLSSLRGWLALLLLCLPAAAFAHKPSDSYLILDLDGGRVEGRWDIALRDLEYALGIDANGDGDITWGEVRRSHGSISDYALARLAIRSGGKRCEFDVADQLIADHSDGAYSVMTFTVACPGDAAPDRLRYALFFDLDPSHRGLVRIESGGGTVQSAILSPGEPGMTLSEASPGGAAQFARYWREGVWHIWSGFDHLLFLLALLLPAVLERRQKRWREVDSFRSAFFNVFAIVTAFTVAHSVTLTLAVLGWVSLPVRLVESVIAVTILLAALNNLFPLVHRFRVLMAFSLGLIHGLGFANALIDLGLPDGALALALVGFNLGVETGQLVLVAAFLPMAFVARNGWFYRRIILGLGSMTVAVIAALWLIERSFDLAIMPV